MEEARIMWRRDPKIRRSDKSEDHDFREHFGCGVIVVHCVWMMMESRELIPNDGMIYHLLCTLMFMKSYTKEKNVYPCWHLRSEDVEEVGVAFY